MSARIAVEGWRLFPHSYALVNQWQILALLRRGCVVDFCDLPYQGAPQPRLQGLLDPESETRIRGLSSVGRGQSYDLCYRIAYPFDLSDRPLSGAKAERVMVFGTAEHQLVSDDYLAGKPDIDRLNAAENFSVVTPSRWSSAGFLNLGLSPERVNVIPHGVDVSTFHGDRSAREEIRNHLNLRGFVFLHCGAMTRNKGVDLLLRAFRILIETHADARLLLKGADALYGSRDLVASYLSELDSADQGKVAERIVYIGQPLPMAAMADLYRAADVYVSPYRAEGFNLPVLEAAACGTPVLCTGGGPTDDFVADTFCRKISSTLNRASGGNWLEPDLDHLVALMRESIEADDFRARAAVEGPSFVSRTHSWEKVVEQLVSL